MAAIMITTHKNTVEYFKDLVEKAMDRQEIHTDETVTFYIVNLLSECVKTEVSFPEGSNDEPLIMLLNHALKSDYGGRVRRFKQIGDFSLFISGFFSDSLKRKLIDIDYYIAIGSIAYNNLSDIMREQRNGGLFYSLFHELTERFRDFTDVIAEVSDMSSVGTNSDLLRIYERWIKTGRLRDADLLREKGVIPVYSEGSRQLQ